MIGNTETAIEHGEALRQKMIANYQRDMRFRALVDTAVHQAVTKHGRIDPDRPEQAAHDIARDAVAFALTSAFEDDAELNFTRQLLEKMRENMLTLASLTPQPMTIP